MSGTLTNEELQGVLRALEKPNRAIQDRFPGETEERQPVHTVYGGAHLFKQGTAKKLGEVALHSFETYAPGPTDLQNAFGIQNAEHARIIHERVKKKLTQEAVEDFRIDFEDGYGVRTDAEEDETSVTAAKETAIGAREGTLPPFIGIRIKTLSEELKARAFRTLDLFVTTLSKEMGGKLPKGFVVTLPKIVNPEQVTALVQVFTLLEKKLALPPQSLQMELMIETPQSIFEPSGKSALPALLDAAAGRCKAAHFGTYDYTASLSITADRQAMDHPACDFARDVMKVSLAGTGVWLSDGATNVMPIEIHKKPSTDAERAENKAAIHRVWKLNFDHVQHSLKNAYYQGWDLHPAQLPVRYIALYSFFLAGLAPATSRLKNFIDQAARATLVGDVFDDAATGQGLLNFFLRALNCKAITEDEILATGLTLQEVRLRSFKKIIEGRKVPSAGSH